MATLIEETELRGMFDIHPDITSGRLTRAIGAAARRLRVMVGATVYDDAASDTTTNTDRKDDLEYAEANLAMHFAILGLNTQIRATGVVKAEKIEGETVVSYLNPAEIQALAAQYLEAAHEIARPYLLADGVPEAEIGFAEIE